MKIVWPLFLEDSSQNLVHMATRVDGSYHQEVSKPISSCCGSSAGWSSAWLMGAKEWR